MNDVERIRDYFATTRWSPSPARQRMADERRALLIGAGRALRTAFSDLKVCDVGCGDGGDLEAWKSAGVPEIALAGTELLSARAAMARNALPVADIRIVNGFELPFDDGAFDLCSASLVLSSIRDASDRGRLLAEMARVTRDGGLVVLYDFTIRKPWNHNVRPITTRHLTRLWRRPDAIRLAAPFLPIAEAVSRLPVKFQGPIVRTLPRTHRLWIWRIR